MPNEPPTDRHLWQIVPVRDFLWIAGAAFLLWFGYWLRGVFAPVLIGLLLAYLFNPLVAAAETRWRLPRVVTVTLLLLVMVLAGAAFAAWLGPLLMEQTQTLAKKAPQYVQSLSQRYGIQLGTLSDQIAALAGRLQEDPMGVLQSLLVGTGQAFGMIGVVVGATTQALLYTVLIPIYFFFFAWHFDRITGRLIRFLPVSRRDRALEILRRMDDAVSGFFRGRLVVALLAGVLYAAGWALAAVPYWFLLGFVTGVLTIIPYVSVIAWPMAVLLKYLDVTTAADGAGFSWLSVVVWPSLPYLVVQLVEGWVLTPWIQSQSTDLSAVTVLIVVFIGGAVGGFYGLLLSVPTAACVKILLQEFIVPRLEQWAEKN